MLRKMAQQGKQQSNKMRMPLWSMTPTRLRFLPPKDLEKQCFSKHGDRSLPLPAGPAALTAMFPAALPKGPGRRKVMGEMQGTAARSLTANCHCGCICSRTIVPCSWELGLFTRSMEEQNGALGRRQAQNRGAEKVIDPQR